ncbi:hypothetical protein BX070DRAFT_223390 [Coemansia spiralis]|nr:hypothetical protein BX070DRAFT_223390 [Coemansia spiralis]
MHHQRHASQPHSLHYSQPQMSSTSITQPSATPRPSGLHTFDKSSDEKQALQLPPPHSHPHHVVEHNIPSPATPTSTAEQHGIHPPSPFTSRLRHPSPPLSSSMSSLSMAQQDWTARTARRPSTTREHLTNRRSRLSDILNPIASSTDEPNDNGPHQNMVAPSSIPTISPAVADTNKDQAGPLPSLGSLLASVRSASNGSGASEAPRTSESPSCHSSSATASHIPTQEAAPTTSENAPELEKWRPW